uniref:substrate-binding domain-containing protein n=1 Tax=Acetatifactor sp. TaxID=1872090 RepID=UPI0040570164
MKKRIGVVFAAIALSAVMLSGCQSGSSVSNEDIKIFYAGLESGEYYVNLFNMALSKAEEEGVQLDVEYAENSIEAQDEQIKRAVAEGYDAIICSTVSPDTASELKAIAGNIPIVFVNSAPDDSVLVADKDVYVASNEVVAGEYQAEYVLEQFADKEEINVVILMGPKGHSATIGRTDGVKKILEASGKTINYVFEDYAEFTPSIAQEILSHFLKADIPIDCVICNNDEMAIGAYNACVEANVDTDYIMFVGIDASANGCAAMLEGNLDFTVYQSTKGQCEASVEVAIRLAKGESIQGMEGASEDGKYVWIPFEKVDINNVEQYISE